jgi:hypothetical protein
MLQASASPVATALLQPSYSMQEQGYALATKPKIGSLGALTTKISGGDC